jgi:hypothetical protein
MLSRQIPVANHHSEEPTVHHAAIPVHLIEQARAAGGQPGRPQPPAAPVDAPPDPTPAPARRLVRFAAAAQRLARLARHGRGGAHARARAETPGLRAGSPGGGA